MSAQREFMMAYEARPYYNGGAPSKADPLVAWVPPSHELTARVRAAINNTRNGVRHGKSS